MRIDYDRLRGLVDEASPGPWEVEEFEEQYADCPWVTKFYLGSEDMQSIAVGEATDRYYDQADSNFSLIALAPDMARELLRLRRELTDLRDLMHTNAGYLRKNGHDIAANWNDTHAHRLDRIIEGKQQ